MNKLNRLFELHRIFSQRRRPVPLRVICEEMDCSESTARRFPQHYAAASLKHKPQRPLPGEELEQ